MNEETESSRPPEEENREEAFGCGSPEDAGAHEEGNFGARAGEHFRQGAADAAKAVNDFMPKFRSFAGKSMFKGAYGLSFGVSFTGKLMKDVVFDNVVKGAKEGARAGCDAAVQYRKRRQTEAAENVVDATEVDPSAAAPA